MPRIHILDGALADQIAAGEVVERPASVVKELLENALDAGARTITVEVREGGSSLIRVTDDGGGMVREDAALCVLRHATSKLRTADDLARITTLGFRGEALPSIASVSRFRVLTRTREDVEGTEVTIEGGAPAAVSPVGCAVGTTIEVRDLFWNTPARKKFLKGSASESAHISEVCLRAALVDQALRLTLIRDGRRVREFLPCQDWAERARHVLEGKAVRVEGEQRGVKVRALLSAPEDSRSGAQGLHVFVNGRPVRERQLARSVAFAYGSVLPPGRYPTGVVQLEVDPSEVDVNVHPQKAEVRFQRGREINEALTRVLAQGLGTSAWSGPAKRGPSFWDERLPVGPVATSPALAPARNGVDDPWGLSYPLAGKEPQSYALPPAPTSWGAHDRPRQDGAVPLATESAAPLQGNFGLGTPRAPAIAQQDLGPRASPAPATEQNSFASVREVPRLRALAQVKRLYIVAEGESGLVVLDQHAADERVQYDRLHKQFHERAVALQRLLIPERVIVSAREAALIEAHGDEIMRAGVEVRLIGADAAAIHAVPAILRRAPPERLLRDLLDELARSGERNFGDAIDTALATMACHGAIRAGDTLSLEECQALLDAGARIGEFAGHCPHGRPVLMELPFQDLARRVGR